MLRGCPEQVVRVGLAEVGERHDTRTNGQHNTYTAYSRPRRPTNQVSAWQAGRGSRPTSLYSILARMSRVSARLLRGNCCRGIPAIGGSIYLDCVVGGDVKFDSCFTSGLVHERCGPHGRNVVFIARRPVSVVHFQLRLRH